MVTDVLSEAPNAVREAAKSLAHNSVHVCGVGVAGLRPDPTSWMYFPEADCPFYRVTNFHNYSPNNVARPGEQMGFMAEVSSSPHKPVDKAAVMKHTVQGLVNTTLMRPGEAEKAVTAWQMDVEHGYPVPTLGRDAALAVIQPWLASHAVFSRGRFGGWKYEVGNMDHSVMQGVEWAERMLLGKPETTYGA
jgi:UDP-galactopyranose mutase